MVRPQKDFFLVVLPVATTVVDIHADGERQADDGDDVAGRFQSFESVHVRSLIYFPPAKPFCRQASNTTTLTAFDKFMLREPGSIGKRRR